jgi:phenylpropionate dioxygenase-like ring-hydroxylating dioxygenase large terminal subunit
VNVGQGEVVPVVVDGTEFVVWRGRSGRLGSVPRWCPHLDHDLTEGFVVDDELVCPGHGWSFDCAGRAFKRNEFGREDDKGAVSTISLVDVGGDVRVAR